MLRDNGFFFLAVGFVGLANYALNIAAARRFAPGAYSQFGVILNLLAAFAPISSSVLAAITRCASINRASGDIAQTEATQRALLRYLTPMYVLALILVALFHEQIGRFLRLTTTPPLLFVVVTAFFLFMQTLFQGVAQENGQYGRVSLIFVAEGLFRGVVGVTAILIGVSITGVAGIYALSAALAALYFPRPRRLWRGEIAERTALRPIYRDIGQLTLTNLGMILLINLDIILCRRYLAPETADHYVAISSMAKFFLLVTTSVGVIAFTEIVKAIHQGEAVARPLYLSLGLVMVLGVLFVAFCAVAGPTIFTITFGDAYRASGHALWITACSAFAISLINVEVSYFNARRWFWYLPMLGVSAAVIVGMLHLSRNHLWRYAGIYALGSGALALAFLVLIGVDMWRRGSLHTVPGGIDQAECKVSLHTVVDQWPDLGHAP